MAEGRTTRQDEAAAWFAAVRAGVMLVDQREAFERWRQDPRNQAAYDAMQELWADLAVLKGEAPRPSGIGIRLKVLAAAAVLIVAMGMTGASLMGWLSDPSIQTAVGEQKTQSLPDGSLVSVNVASSVSYAFSNTRRQIRLASGEAAFTVKPDATSPFVVDAGEYQIRAVGTVFNVKKRDREIEVAVSEGKVDICTATGEVLATLASGQLLRFPIERADLSFAGLAPVSVAPAQISEWRTRVVSYENATVQEVVTDFNRYFSRSLRVEGKELRDRRITVRLQVERRERAIDLLAAMLNVQVRSTRDGEVLEDR